MEWALTMVGHGIASQADGVGEEGTDQGLGTRAHVAPPSDSLDGALSPPMVTGRAMLREEYIP